MESKKGISDVIAVVLMIAVAISIGVFVTTFATKWVQDQTSSASISCAIKTNYVVDSAKFNYSGMGRLLVKVTNKGDEGLHGFGFILDNITSIITFNSSSSLITNQVTSASPLMREQSALVTLNLADPDNLYDILVKTIEVLKVTNNACDSVSASATSVTVY
ncbi:MAG: hypothetical protein ISS93_03245 [Candidatus Aenigmarchaeota archaeon]|nr:hypothetical protein [Candidatus Aenigmarchaeota archaeon]